MLREWDSCGDGILRKKRSDGTWSYAFRLRLPDRTYAFEGGYATKQAALRARARSREQLLIGRYKSRSEREVEQQAAKDRTITFRGFAAIYDRDYASQRQSREEWYGYQLRVLVREFGDEPLLSIDRHRIQRYLATLSRTLAPATVNHRRRFIGNLYNRAIEWGYATENPVRFIRQLREPPIVERFFTQAETDRLIEYSSGHVRAIIQIALLTGMREGEILGLKRHQVDASRQQLTLWRTKSGKKRVVDLCDDAVTVLQPFLENRKPDDHIFLWGGKGIASVKRAWRLTLKRARVKGRFHDLRHTWASRMINGGAITNLAELMEVGGWDSIEMVRRYAHLFRDTKKRAVQSLNGTVPLKGCPRKSTRHA